LKRVTMSEDVTIFTSANHTSIVKTFSGIDLTEQAFATGKDFNVSEEPVSDLQSLSKLLQKLENDSTRTIIRGSLIEDQTNPVSRNKETFTATPRQWCMIDIDSLDGMGTFKTKRRCCHMPFSSFPHASNRLTVGIIFHPAWESRLVSGCIYGFG
jgi:hypothetical protein